MSSSDISHSRSRLTDGVTTERVTFRATDAQLEGLETLVDDDVFPNRSEAIRAAIDELVTAETRGDSE